MNIDGMYRDSIGEFGRGQRLYALIVCCLNSVIAFNMVFLVIGGAQANFGCYQDNVRPRKLVANGSAACRLLEEHACDSIHFHENNRVESIVQEWNLVCEKAYLKDMAQSITMVGVLVGAVFFGVLSDRIGRKPTVRITAALVIFANVITASSPGFLVFAGSRLLAGFGTAGLGIVSYVLGSELIGPSVRAMYAAGTTAFFAIGIVIVAAVGSIFPLWRQFTGVLIAITTVLCAGIYFLPESPHWLSTQRMYDDCRAVLLRISAANGNRAAHVDKIQRLLGQHERPGKLEGANEPAVGFSAVVNHRLLRFWTLILAYSWLCNSAVYYGLTMASGSLSDNLFWSVAFSGLSELPAYLIIQMFVNRIGRKSILCSAMLFSGSACLAVMFVPASARSYKVALAMLGKLGVSSSFLMIYIHSSEIFPTNIRTAGMGVCSMSARIGGILSPMIGLLGQSIPGMEFFIFGLMGLSAGLVNLCLPETFQKQLPETPDDVDRIFGEKVV